MMAIYRMLSDHWIGNQILEAGTLQNDNPGGLLPSGWVPTVGVDPQDQDAINKFWLAGPGVLNAGQSYLFLLPLNGRQGQVARPSIFWVATGSSFGADQLYILTGAG